MLSSVHRAFGVDDSTRHELIFGQNDPVPALLADDPLSTLRQMIGVDWSCILARPSRSHGIIGELHRSNRILKIFTDNVDDLFQQSGLPHFRTRGDGLFNVPVNVKFSRQARSLLVIGVSADRRGIICSARKSGLKIVVINPCLPVSPFSRNLDYVRPDDVFIRQTALKVLPNIVRQLLGGRVPAR
jgi:NAD-dependent SIR2 family protein deacetylase